MFPKISVCIGVTNMSYLKCINCIQRTNDSVWMSPYDGMNVSYVYKTNGWHVIILCSVILERCQTKQMLLVKIIKLYIYLSVSVSSFFEWYQGIRYRRILTMNNTKVLFHFTVHKRGHFHLNIFKSQIPDIYIWL